MTYWCEHVWIADRAVDGVVLTVVGGVITDVECGVASPPAQAIRLDGVTFPGIANAHSHTFHRALRARTHAGGGTFWTWRERMYDLANALEPDAYEELAAATFAEMVLSGYTAVGEFHYLHHSRGGVPYADPNEMGRRLIAAAARAGIRLTLLDTCYLHGGFGQPVNDVQKRFADATFEKWAARVSSLTGNEMARIGAAIHSVRAVDPDAIADIASWADRWDAVLHAHVSEQPKENQDCLSALGCTPTVLLARSGALSDRFTAVHATHLAPGDINLLASRGSRCCICATTERDLADGIGPTAAFREADIPMCIGSDSHAVIDPFEEMRAIEMNERLASLRRGTHQPSELLTSATATGYASLGWDGGGVIAPGALGDFVTVGLDSRRLAGSDREDLAAAVALAATASDVRHVVIGGEHIVRDSVHQRVDVVTALSSSIAAAWAAVAER